MTYSVLFVCTGNICRSPTAHGAFRHVVQAAGMSRFVAVESAGTHGYHIGDPPDPRSVAAAKARGVMIHDLRARKLVAADADRFDLILAMDRGHLYHIQKMIPPGSLATASLFLDYAPEATLREVPDPYYGGAADFELVLDLVAQGVEGLLAHVRRFETGAESG